MKSSLKIKSVLVKELFQNLFLFYIDETYISKIETFTAIQYPLLG